MPRPPAKFAAERRLALPSAARAGLLELARLMADAEAARIAGEFDDTVGDLRAALKRPAEP